MKNESAKDAKKEVKTVFQGTYVAAVGRRKRAVATVRLYKGEGKILINERSLKEYFGINELQQTVLKPLEIAGTDKTSDVSVHVMGGGTRGQADAIALGIARALVESSQELRPSLKKLGFLRRDPRKKERKKYGLKRARRAPQFSKR